MRNIFVIVIVLLGCSETSVNPLTIDRGEAFFPAQVGCYWEYEVEEVNYLISEEVERVDYQLREEIVESFLSSQDTVFVIYRYTRPEASEEWQPSATWQLRKSEQNITIFEGNTPVIKLAFPIEAGKTWDANALNIQEQDIYVIDSLYDRFSINEWQFDSTLTVIQSDNQDFIVEQDRRYEMYAYNIGLILKEELQLQYCTNDNCLGQQEIVTGRAFRQTLLRYGKM